MEIKSKICSKCDIEKDLGDFPKQKNGYLGRRSNCKECVKIQLEKWKKKNPNYNKNYRLKNKKQINKNSLKYYNNNKEKHKKYSSKYSKINSEKLNEYGKEYYKNNKTDLNEYGKEYYKNNKNKFRQYARNRYKKTNELAAIKWMRNFLYRTEKHGFNKSKMNTIMEFGYTPKQLILRIECQFKEGMSWDNRSEWHIDHKKPISKFNKNMNPRIINMLCNLQPLWKNENLGKSNIF